MKDKVKEFLKKYNLDNNILTTNESSATVDLAAKAFNTSACRIAKSLSFYIDDRNILIVVAGNMKIDNSKYKAEFQNKARMIPADEVLKKIGHPVGGVCPFAINDDVEVYLDISLQKYETVFPACGKPNNAIELTPQKLEEIVKPIKWVDVCKEVENE